MPTSSLTISFSFTFPTFLCLSLRSSFIHLVKLPFLSSQKSPVLSDPKKPSHQSSVISHPLATAATHPKLRLPTLHPPLPLVTRLPPPIISLPLLPGQSAPIAGNPGLLNSVPGLGVIRTSQPVVRPPVVKDYQAEAEFLLSQKRSRPASPPLTADEFYRQQKILNQFIL